MQITSQLTDETVLQELGQRLAHTRLNRNMPQEALATAAGVSVPTVQRIERGDPTEIRSLIRVMRVLDLLESLDLAIPPPIPSPIEQLKLQGRNRQRASSRSSERGSTGLQPWRWGDESPDE
jgi:putative transcriptional regulator